MEYEFKGTKGSWHVEHDSSGDEFDDSHWPWKINSESGEAVTYLEDCSDENANLIAAAPDLLEALIDLLPHADYGMGSDHPTYQKAISAIHKALNIKA